ncbi:MAG: DUF4013 domain-containing protein [Candidatus Bruticola sp.]
MQFLKPINYIMDAPQIVKKIFILLIFTIFIITIPAVGGYTVKIIKNIRSGKLELPDLEFGDFSELFSEGCRVFLQMFLLMLPAVIFIGIGMAIMFTQDSPMLGIVFIIIGLVGVFIASYLSSAIFCLAAKDSDWMLIKFDKIHSIMYSENASYLKLFAFIFVWNIIFNAVSMVPIVGIVIPMLLVFVQGVLCGEYMRLVDPEDNATEAYDIGSGSDKIKSDSAYFS